MDDHLSKIERDGFTVVTGVLGVEQVDAIVRDAAERKQNVMPAVMDAVKAYATLSEITAVFKSVYGVFKEPVIL